MEDYNKMIVNIGSTSWEARKGGGSAVVREFVQHLSNTDQDYINLEVHNEENRRGNDWYYAKVTDSLLVKNIKLAKSLSEIAHNSVGQLYFVTHNIPVLLLSFLWIKLSPRVVHVHYFHGPAYMEASAEGAGWLRCRLIKMIELLFYSCTRRLIFLSESFYKIFETSYFKRFDGVIVPYSIASRPLPKIVSRSESQGPFKMLSVRRLQKRMGLDILIDACSLLERDFELNIVGIGPEYENLSKLIKKHGLEGKVTLYGRLSDSALNELIADCDVTIMPTRSLEGFGISIIDSLVLGVPVLAFKVGGMPEILEGLHKGLIVNEISAEALALRLEEFMSEQCSLPSAIECRAYIEGFYCDNYPKLLEWMYTF